MPLVLVSFCKTPILCLQSLEYLYLKQVRVAASLLSYGRIRNSKAGSDDIHASRAVTRLKVRHMRVQAYSQLTRNLQSHQRR